LKRSKKIATGIKSGRWSVSDAW